MSCVRTMYSTRVQWKFPKTSGFDIKQNINLQFIAFLQFLHFTMQSDDDNDENDQSSYYESSSDDDEMIHTTASRKEVRNTILFKFIMISIVQYKQHDFYCSTCIFCNIIPCYIASHQRVSCLSY
jgi:hypothetical protein